MAMTSHLDDFNVDADPAPTIAVWEESRHPWVSLPSDMPPERGQSRADKTAFADGSEPLRTSQRNFTVSYCVPG